MLSLIVLVVGALVYLLVNTPAGSTSPIWGKVSNLGLWSFGIGLACYLAVNGAFKLFN